eukprot:Seg815.7 transcript_id=Seg815.7/GoldUCD/mRNA.D3Y31 product="Oxysterol-binding protein-related protein 8" protein_id=Seg815.7/GoldUCD/D3Y31
MESVLDAQEGNVDTEPEETASVQLEKKSPSLTERSSLKTGVTSSAGNYKDRKKTYKKEKRRVAKEVSSALKDKSVVILSSWLKIRGTLKSWAKFWCVVKPGWLIIYKSNKHHHWVGTVVLSCCEVIERPSSKEGYCFKLFHPLKEYIWTTKGPKGEISGSLSQPMPRDHLILRAPTVSMGHCWMDAIEVAQKSTVLNPDKMMHSDLYGEGKEGSEHANDDDEEERNFTAEKSDDVSSIDENDHSDRGETEDLFACATETEAYEESDYSVPTQEYLGEEGEAVEEMEEDSKSVLWALLKQVRPGMDLSKVTLPTFILEPRSFLDKLSDYYYHADYLANAAREENPYTRIKEIVKWYLSGFYKKPKGLKKPYNPIIGETFRCMWPNQKTGSRTFFVAEQVSHHPPVSAFYCSNRQDGYVTFGSILAKSKFYGNSSSAILDGAATVTLLKLGEDYILNMPYAHIKGILLGTLTAELGGKVIIKCEKTGYSAEIEFKLKPFWNKSAQSNKISGKIKMGKDVLSKIEGKWDGEIFITEYAERESQGDDPLSELFFDPAEAKRERLKRYTVDLENQDNFESEKLWAKVSEAIKAQDQEAATREKLVLEDNQRAVHKELKEKNEDWKPHFFERDAMSDNPHAWVYKFSDLRPWDLGTDVSQYEHKGVIKTVTRHVTPVFKRSASIPNVRSSSMRNSVAGRLPSIVEPHREDFGSKRDCDRSSQEIQSSDDDSESRSQLNTSISPSAFMEHLQPLITAQQETQKQLTALRVELKRFKAEDSLRASSSNELSLDEFLIRSDTFQTAPIPQCSPKTPPGRVVTLIPDTTARTWGVAYQVLPASVPEVMAYLNHREKGGYTLHDVQFNPKDTKIIKFPVYVYIATESNEAFLGDAPLADIAKQIATSHGPSGPNSEYLLNLAKTVREMKVEDEHLFELEKRVSEELINNKFFKSVDTERFSHVSKGIVCPNKEIDRED